MDSVKFLGHVISVEGISADPDKISAICKLSPPTCRREARSLMGMVNYLNKFSKKLAEICVPIYELTGSGDWYWGVEQEAAFEQIKDELSKAPVLCTFNLESKHRVSSDASRLALGAVLLQLNSCNLWQPVEFASRKLTPTEQNYAMIELEALGITWACEKFDFYLVGRTFEVETDHRPLVSLLGEKDLSQLPIRVQRFKMRLMRYDFSIFHSPGSCMFIADYLSRPSANSEVGYDDVDIYNCRMVESYVASCLEQILPDNLQQQELIYAISQDADCLDVLNYIHGEWPCNISNLTDEVQRLYKVRDHLSAYDDVILYDNRSYIPKSLRSKYLDLCHEGHQGIIKCLRRARAHFWWPSCAKDVENFVTNCDVCIKFRRIAHQPMAETLLPDGPWCELGSDTFVFKDQYFLLIVDYYTKWIEVCPLTSLSSNCVIEEFKNVFSCFGTPQVLRSDNAGCYNSQNFKIFAETWGFKQTFSSPRYPESNGLAERSVGTMKSLLYKSPDLHTAILAYHTTPLTEGFSPSQLMFGRAINSPLGKPLNVHVNYEEYERICKENKEKRILKWNQKHHAKYLPELKPGQLVFVKAPTDIGKEGIVDKKDVHPDSYWVIVENSIIRRNRKHLFILQRPQSPDSDDSILPLALEEYGSEGSITRELDSSANTDCSDRTNAHGSDYTNTNCSDHTNAGSSDNLANSSEAGARVDDNNTNDGNSTPLCDDLLECDKEPSAYHNELPSEINPELDINIELSAPDTDEANSTPHIQGSGDTMSLFTPVEQQTTVSKFGRKRKNKEFKDCITYKP